MAKRRGRRRGVGSVIRVRKLSGVGQLKNPNSVMGAALPVVIGGGVVAMTAIGLRQFMTPTTQTQMRIVENAPWVGIGAGTLVSLALWNMSSQAAGVGALTAGLTIGIGMIASEFAARSRMSQVAPAAAAPTAGLRAVVPEYSMAGVPRSRRSGSLGVIAMEPHASRGYGAGPLGSYGETVNLGAVNASAFGTPGFTVR